MRFIRRSWEDRDGASAVEFALIAPLFLLIVLTLIAYGIYLSAVHAVQQVAADAARSAVAGYNETERRQLASEYIRISTMDYAFLDRNAFHVNVASDKANPNQFTVTVEYDATALPIWNLYTFMLPDKTIRKFSTIRIGGI